MDRLHAMYAFRAVVEHGGYAAAARALGRSKTALSRAVAELEQHLGVRLLHRSTRRVTLSEAGRQYHARCTQLLADLEELEGEARDTQGSVRGLLRVAGPHTFGELFLVPLIAEFLQREPGVTLDLTLTDRFVDLVEERFDLAIRVADLRDSSLIARPLGTMQLVLCASPDYLARHGTPDTPEAVAAHACVVDFNLRQPRLWTFLDGETRHQVRISGRVSVNSALAARELALRGVAIALSPDFVINEDLRQGRLVSLLPGYTTPVRGIHAVYANRQHLPRRLRALIEFLAARLQSRMG